MREVVGVRKAICIRVLYVRRGREEVIVNNMICTETVSIYKISSDWRCRVLHARSPRR